MLSNTKNRFVFFILILFAVAFSLTNHLSHYPLSFLVKSIPIFLLAYLAFTNIKNKRGRRVAVGLCFSGIGDIFLELSIPNGFIFGIAAFAVAHLFYISVFFYKPKITIKRIPILLILGAYVVAIILVLYPNLGTMLTPILVYLGIIVIMAFSAILGSENNSLIIAGALLFVVSDSLIAINRFVLPILYSGFWIMITYYIAQILISFGAFQSFGKTIE